MPFKNKLYHIALINLSFICDPHPAAGSSLHFCLADFSSTSCSKPE